MSTIEHNPLVDLNNAQNLNRAGDAPTAPPPVEFKTTLDVSAEAGVEAVRVFAINFLRVRGYTVIPPDAPWERAGDFCRRVGLMPQKLHSILERFANRGGTAPRLDRRGKSQRIAGIQSHKQFDDFCRSLSRSERRP